MSTYRADTEDGLFSSWPCSRSCDSSCGNRSWSYLWERWIPEIVMEYFPFSDDQYGCCPWTGVLRHSFDMDVNVDIACFVRIIKQNAMQSFLCRLEESALSSGKWMRVDKPFRLPKNMKTYEILMLPILHSFRNGDVIWKLHIVLYYRLLRSCKAEVTWRELCGLQNSGLPILDN